jgi:hypothetical protein
MANTENIEAKLCAYVDGELDDAGRAEIEAHLASNAQHRQLLEELRGQRALLAGLPRSAAPEDIAETITSRLERSVLLDNIDADEDDAALRINRWPQYVLAAAVVFLAVGLGAVIYFVLPAPRNTPYATTVISGAAATAPAAPPAEARRLAAAKNAGKAGAPAKKADEPAIAQAEPFGVGEVGGSAVGGGVGGGGDSSHIESKAAASGVPGGVAMKKSAGDAHAKYSPNVPTALAAAAPSTDPFAPLPELKIARGENRFNNIFADATADPDIARQLKQSVGGAPAKPLLVVLNCADPSAANVQVMHYLASNGIAWEELPEATPAAASAPAPAAVADDEDAIASRLSQQRMQLKVPAAPPAVENKAFEDATAAKPRDRTAKSEAPPPVATVQPAPTPISPPAAPAPPSTGAAGSSSTNNAPVASKPAQNAAPAPPSPSEAQKEPIDQNKNDQVQQEPVQPQQVQQQMMSRSLILARGMTRRQIRELNSLTQETQILPQSASARPAPTAAAAMAQSAATLPSMPDHQAGGVEGFSRPGSGATRTVDGSEAIDRTVAAPEAQAPTQPAAKEKTSPSTQPDFAQRVEKKPVTSATSQLTIVGGVAAAPTAPPAATAPSTIASPPPQTALPPATAPAAAQKVIGAVAVAGPSQSTTQPASPSAPATAPTASSVGSRDLPGAVPTIAPVRPSAALERVDVVILVQNPGLTLPQPDQPSAPAPSLATAQAEITPASQSASPPVPTTSPRAAAAPNAATSVRPADPAAIPPGGHESPASRP